MIAQMAETIQYRIKNVVARDLKVRYRNSLLGFVWCLANPLLMMGVFTLVFTVLMRSNIDKFPVFVLIGIIATDRIVSYLRQCSASRGRDAAVMLQHPSARCSSGAS